MNHAQEYARKSIHLIFGVMFLEMINLLGSDLSIKILSFLLGAGLLLSAAVKSKIRLPLIDKILDLVERENEKSFPGKAAIFFFASAIILLFFFGDNKIIVLASLSVQVFADAFAAIIGINFGKHRILGKKTLEGSTACFLVALLCLAYFCPLYTALIAAAAATIVELIPLDDNFWVPLTTAAVLKVLL